jgi:hypothetical protein
VSNCGVGKPGTYCSGYPTPVCDLDPKHGGYHHAIVRYPRQQNWIADHFVEYTWLGSVEMQALIRDPDLPMGKR